jgi:UDP-N-acetylmuramyl tripeptide synthase
MKLELLDSRRLTGANLHWDRPSAILDVAIEGPAESVIKAWQAAAEHWLDAVGYADEATCSPIDVLYSMCELNEAAWAAAAHACGAGPIQSAAPDPDEVLPRLTRLFDEERNPRLLALQAAARERGAPLLWDDEAVSLGYGRFMQCWKPSALPAPEEVDWASIRPIPLALVTGTNGKSTTVRMAAAIIAAAGFRAGLTSTDFIRVGDRVIDTGDYSGTGGARMLLRQPDVEMAVLEVARGGLLRRGLGVERADVALITNVAADHLGEYGIHSVPELIEAKFIVRKALAAGDRLLLNADDEGVVAYARSLGPNRQQQQEPAPMIDWFSLDVDNPQLRHSLRSGGRACYLEDGWLVAAEGARSRRVAALTEIPATLGGIVRHNVANALGAMAIALAFGIDDGSIRAGLAAFRGDERDNPGRGNWFEQRVEGGSIRILVDFAHNAHGMRALAETVRRLPAERIVLLVGQAGDRLDQDIADLVAAACSMRPDQLLVAELPGYERGRAPFEVPELIRRNAVTRGLAEERIRIFDGPREATRFALRQARPGDLLVLLALTQRQEALDLVHEFIGGGVAAHG